MEKRDWGIGIAVSIFVNMIAFFVLFQHVLASPFSVVCSECAGSGILGSSYN